jgi:hypothetical protein
MNPATNTKLNAVTTDIRHLLVNRIRCLPTDRATSIPGEISG